MKTKNLDMTQGSPLRLLIAFSVPLLLGNLLQQAYYVVDSIIVGRYVGAAALAAIGATQSVLQMLVAVIIGLNTGISILISQAFGARDLDGVRRTFAGGVLIGLWVSLVMAAAGCLAARPVLTLMNTDGEVLRDAVTYLQINFATSVLPIFYFLLSGVFRSIGDSTTALFCLLVSSVCNVGLDWAFVALLRWGVAGAAWSTALSQAFSILYAWVRLARGTPFLRLGPGDLRPDKTVLLRIFKLAVPLSLQSSFTGLGGMLVQACVNGFGTLVMAGYTAASRIGNLILVPMSTLGNALSIYVGQNHGAGQTGRIRAGVRTSLGIALAVSTALGALVVLLADPLIGLFLAQPQPEMLAAARTFLWIAAAPSFLAGVMYIYQFALRGVGRAGASMAGGLTELLAKAGLAALGAWVLKDLNTVWLAWPVSFLAGSLLPIFALYRALRASPDCGAGGPAAAEG